MMCRPGYAEYLHEKGGGLNVRSAGQSRRDFEHIYEVESVTCVWNSVSQLEIVHETLNE